MNLFRNLTNEEVEVRAARKFNGKAELLIYKNARVDMNLLDETFGPYGWSVQYKEENGILFCGVALKDPKTNVWIWRWNAGSEGNFEKEKSVASDSFKRTCFLFGLGRELYTAPKIIVPCENEYETWTVEEIGYDKKDRIVDLIISDSKGNIVFRYIDGKIVKNTDYDIDPVEILQTVCKELKEQGEDYKELGKFYKYYESIVDKWENTNEKTIKKLWDRWNTK